MPSDTFPVYACPGVGELTAHPQTSYLAVPDKPLCRLYHGRGLPPLGAPPTAVFYHAVLTSER